MRSENHSALARLRGDPAPLLAALNALGRSHAAIAQCVGVTAPVVSAWAAGRSIPQVRRSALKRLLAQTLPLATAALSEALGHPYGPRRARGLDAWRPRIAAAKAVLRETNTPPPTQRQEQPRGG